MTGGFLCVAAPLVTIPIMVRRLHDLDMSGWCATGLWLFGLVPGFGVLVLIGSAFLLSRDGAPGLTGFGPDPKGRNLITVFDPRLPAKPAPIPEVPVPAEPEAERPYWTPYFVFVGIGLASVVLGYNLFMMRAMSPDSITIKDIYTSIVPFLILMVVAIVLIMVFPQIALWLPDYVNGNAVGPVDWLVTHCDWFRALCESAFHYTLP